MRSLSNYFGHLLVLFEFSSGCCGVACSGSLVDSHPIVSGLDENDEELAKLSVGVQMLIYGMVGWLSVVTIAAICIFVVVYVRMSRMAKSLDDAETGSSISSKSSRSVSAASWRWRTSVL